MARSRKIKVSLIKKYLDGDLSDISTATIREDRLIELIDSGRLKLKEGIDLDTQVFSEMIYNALQNDRLIKLGDEALKMNFDNLDFDLDSLVDEEPKNENEEKKEVVQEQQPEKTDDVQDGKTETNEKDEKNDPKVKEVGSMDENKNITIFKIDGREESFTDEELELAGVKMDIEEHRKIFYDTLLQVKSKEELISKVKENIEKNTYDINGEKVVLYNESKRGLLNEQISEVAKESETLEEFRAKVDSLGKRTRRLTEQPRVPVNKDGKEYPKKDVAFVSGVFEEAKNSSEDIYLIIEKNKIKTAKNISELERSGMTAEKLQEIISSSKSIEEIESKITESLNNKEKEELNEKEMGTSTPSEDSSKILIKTKNGETLYFDASELHRLTKDFNGSLEDKDKLKEEYNDILLNSNSKEDFNNKMDALLVKLGLPEEKTHKAFEEARKQDIEDETKGPIDFQFDDSHGMIKHSDFEKVYNAVKDGKQNVTMTYFFEEGAKNVQLDVSSLYEEGMSSEAFYSKVAPVLNGLLKEEKNPSKPEVENNASSEVPKDNTVTEPEKISRDMASESSEAASEAEKTEPAITEHDEVADIIELSEFINAHGLNVLNGEVVDVSGWEYKGTKLVNDVGAFNKMTPREKKDYLEQRINEIDKEEEKRIEDEKRYMTIKDFIEMSVDYYVKTEGKAFNTFVLNGREVNLAEYVLNEKGEKRTPEEIKAVVLADSVKIIEETHGKSKEEKHDPEKTDSDKKDPEKKDPEKKDSEREVSEESSSEEKGSEDEVSEEESSEKKDPEKIITEEEAKEQYLEFFKEMAIKSSELKLFADPSLKGKRKEEMIAKSKMMFNDLLVLSPSELDKTPEEQKSSREKKMIRFKDNYANLIRYENAISVLYNESATESQKEAALAEITSLGSKKIEDAMELKSTVAQITLLDKVSGIESRFATNIGNIGEYKRYSDSLREMDETMKASKKARDRVKAEKELAKNGDMAADVDGAVKERKEASKDFREAKRHYRVLDTKNLFTFALDKVDENMKKSVYRFVCQNSSYDPKKEHQNATKYNPEDIDRVRHTLGEAYRILPKEIIEELEQAVRDDKHTEVDMSDER